MKSMLEQIKEYLNNTPKDQLEKDFEELEEWLDVGPTVDEYFENLKYFKNLSMSNDDVEEDNSFADNKDKKIK